MLIKQLTVPKNIVSIISEDATLEEAITLLEETGYRCVPVLDQSEKIFRGNIYKMHIYRHKANGGDMSLPVTHLLKNATKYVHINSSFFKIFFMIKDLPYITVLDENNHFFGILTHSTLIDLLQQSWSIDSGSYVLTIASPGEKGDLTNISKIINRHCSIMSCITLDNQRENMVRRTIMTLEPDVSEKTLNEIKKNLARKGFKVVQAENLHND
ncbi:MAG: cyclic di-AMP binding protein CbpA [Alkalibacterium gilvum]|uniref:CBS domain-containing protein n=1 Tax=Alkalibacterium gilvum TaxID=1130080 RepID=A0A1H6S0Y3_9LACT|nr:MULTISPECIES: cyclic di-AMP binding protein CbpA [Alkalibacterium]MDN6293583.1 cyclic di-AMP binding protein CbpA [Alkalibacterium sp.]MDN6295294.1 cyclic di-AMP binding protein CbpA [Alkalibacterium sp.]MDN6397561.1 cyclic di-AMP binding protein CbpA [Alkalibacterium sp.]MDN6729737.1 cyclic di-AMP binding protein CbpA [Alkalibacterium sp.]SEI61569.1 CBS domain-containing protein [Alkalibacterium gilvum]